MTLRRALALAGAALALALLAGRLLAGAYADWAWFDALGMGSVWRARVVALTTLRAGLFAVAFVFSFVNLLAMRRSIVSLVLPRRLANLVIGEAVPGRLLTLTAAVLSVVIAAAVSLPQGDWVVLLRAQWATPLGEIDPYLGRDIAFWTAWLPFERMLRAWAVLLAAVVGAAVMILYALTPSVHVQRGQLHVSTWVRRHFAVYSAFLLLLIAWGFRLDSFDLLIHGSGVREAFTAFDHRVLYPYLIALSICTAACGALVAWTGWIGYQRAMLGSLLMVLVAGPLGRLGLPLLDRRAVNGRERSALERPYEHARTLYTRRAFGVDEILRGIRADSLRVPVDAIGQRVSGWDPAALALAAAAEPTVAPTAGAGTWRVAGGDSLRAVIAYGGAESSAPLTPLIVQELDPADADERGGPWPSGATDYATLPPLAVGLDLAGVRLIADTLGRVAAPAFGTGWRRIALAWGVRNLRLTFGDPDSTRTRLLMHRDVRARVRTLLPFFTAGPTPQALVAHDSLWWSVELFNASADYPLTEPLLVAGQTRRFAVPAGVALVNAHSGRVQVLLPNRPDKMTRWWRDHLPAPFVTGHGVDEDVLAALPAPVDRAVVQGSALARTGFRTDTLSARPLFVADDADVELLPGAPTPFVSNAAGHPLAWGVPAVDGLDRMRGVFVAVGGRVPRTALVEQPDSVRWSSLLDRLQRVADSARISRTRRHPRRGRVQVIPTTSGTLLVQSFYEWVPDRVPSLAGIVALHGGDARTAMSLAASLGAPAHTLATEERLRLHVARIYVDLQDARRRGDWVAFGRALDMLGRLISGGPPRRE
ncbi:MAG: UPF0182 family protein [Gemmatimonadaceae bacterium]|nr:UPF0182 family protein [Gemmatimonadaceae bacterium]